MDNFTAADLRRYLESNSGEVEDIDWTDDKALGQQYSDIGYDSLAILELCAAVQRDFRVPLPDDAVFDMTTPTATIDYINNRIAAGEGVSNGGSHG